MASFFPSASANVGAQYNFGRSIDPETNTYNNTTVFYNSYNANTEIPIFQGGQLINQVLKAYSNVKMGKNNIQKEKDDLAMKTMQAYMDVLYYQQTRQMAAEKLKESSAILYRTQRQEQLGVKSRADVAQFEAQVAADDYTLTQQESLFNTSVLTLKQCMNYPSDLDLPIDTVATDAIFELQPSDNADAIFMNASITNQTPFRPIYKLTESKYLYRWSKGRSFPSLFSMPA